MHIRKDLSHIAHSNPWIRSTRTYFSTAEGITYTTRALSQWGSAAEMTHTDHELIVKSSRILPASWQHLGSLKWAIFRVFRPRKIPKSTAIPLLSQSVAF